MYCSIMARTTGRQKKEERRAINTVKKLTASEREKSNVYYTN